MLRQKCSLALILASLLAAGVHANQMTTNPGSSSGTQGSGGVVHFTGEITDVSCNISTGSKDQTVDLGRWAKSYFDSQSETTLTPFKISVDGCPESVTSVAVLFDGNKDKDPSLLKLNGVAGSATGVGVKLYDRDRSASIPIGTVSTAVKPSKEGKASLTFYAGFAANGEAINTGTANADSNFLMIYN